MPTSCFKCYPTEFSADVTHDGRKQFKLRLQDETVLTYATRRACAVNFFRVLKTCVHYFSAYPRKYKTLCNDVNKYIDWVLSIPNIPKKHSWTQNDIKLYRLDVLENPLNIISIPIGSYLVSFIIDLPFALICLWPEISLLHCNKHNYF